MESRACLKLTRHIILSQLKKTDRIEPKGKQRNETFIALFEGLRLPVRCATTFYSVHSTYSPAPPITEILILSVQISLRPTFLKRQVGVNGILTTFFCMFTSTRLINYRDVMRASNKCRSAATERLRKPQHTANITNHHTTDHPRRSQGNAKQQIKKPQHRAKTHVPTPHQR